MSNFYSLPVLIALSIFLVACSDRKDDQDPTPGATTTEAGPTDVATGNTATAGNTGGEPAEPPAPTTGGDNGPTPTPVGDAFGLTERASLKDLNLPIDGVSLGDFQLVNVYPNISFQEALLVDDVPGENRMVVVEQFGRIKVFNDDPGVTEVTEILDYSEKISVVSGEQGLLGFAFDPNFVENRYVYTYHTEVVTNKSIITRFVWDRDSDALDVSNIKIVMTIDQPFETHNGGMMAFGTDNFLYVSLGDGGDGGDPFNNAQDRSTLLGSVIRIDVNTPDDSVGYLVPESNPFFGEENVRPEIWAYGFRNPWRFSFDRLTGDMWLGDVGQAGFEEISLVKAGGNYGWRVYEGTRPNESNLNVLPDSAFTPPVYEYDHDQGLAVIGGYVYRGSVAALQGKYLFTDFYNGTVMALTLDGETVTAVESIATVEGPTSFGENRDGEVLVVSRYGGIFKFAQNTANIEFPATLTDTGVFADVASLTPTSGLVEYTPSHPFWSDGAIKRRWIGLPDGVKIDFSENDWNFPLGTVSVKHFEMEMIENTPSSARRLETRVMYNTKQGWEGFTYRWNAEQTEAFLISDRETEQLTISLNDGTSREQRYDYPSPADCSTCHSEPATYLLGLETKQLNADFAYANGTDNQLRSLNNIGMFNYNIGASDQYDVLQPVENESASLQERARAYLDVNCSTCHQPRGAASTSMDFRYETANEDMVAIDKWPQSGQFGVSDPRIIAAGSKERSLVYYRMATTEEGRMPPISSHVVDEAGLKLIGDWIDSLQ